MQRLVLRVMGANKVQAQEVDSIWARDSVACRNLSCQLTWASLRSSILLCRAALGQAHSVPEQLLDAPRLSSSTKDSHL